MMLDTTRLQVAAAAQTAAGKLRDELIGNGVFSGTSPNAATVIGTIAIAPYSAGIIWAMCSGLDDSRNAYHIIKAMTFKHDGLTLTVPDTISDYAPAGEVAASVSFAVNGDNLDITVSGTGNINWKVSYLINGVVNDNGLA